MFRSLYNFYSGFIVHGLFVFLLCPASTLLAQEVEGQNRVEKKQVEATQPQPAELSSTESSSIEAAQPQVTEAASTGATQPQPNEPSPTESSTISRGKPSSSNQTAESNGEQADSSVELSTETPENQLEVEDDWDDDDDWGKDGPVDRTVYVSGVASVSFYSTFFEFEEVNRAITKEDEHTFDLEHIHVKVTGNLTNELSYTIQPELNMQDGFKVIEADLTYEFAGFFQLTAGRFILPFGFNRTSLIGSFMPVSRPLLYPGHESRSISFGKYSPSGFMYTTRDDMGVQATGSLWIGEEENMQLWYSAYVANGLKPDSISPARNWLDNNRGKGIGGELVFSVYFDHWDFSLGGSGTWSRYQDEDKLDYYAGGVDARISARIFGDLLTTLRAEMVLNPKQVIQKRRDDETGDEVEDIEDETVDGFYVVLENGITSWLSVFAQFDRLSNRSPCPERMSRTTINRILGGVVAVPNNLFELKLEYSYWINQPIPSCRFQNDEALELPEVHRIIGQVVVSI